ncbi:MAG: hypothetical protein HY749_06445 [Gammaproteobacteria bacterium]|nr:hypothetical protein [Gammaproteobacteria bacterium]
MARVTPLATCTLLAVDRSGREFPLTLVVGAPYETGPQEWACPVRLDGLPADLRDRHGVDSWQALQLAMRLLAHLLGCFIEDGGKLLWPDTREEIAVEELFP